MKIFWINNSMNTKQKFFSQKLTKMIKILVNFNQLAKKNKKDYNNNEFQKKNSNNNNNNNNNNSKSCNLKLFRKKKFRKIEENLKNYFYDISGYSIYLIQFK